MRRRKPGGSSEPLTMRFSPKLKNLIDEEAKRLGKNRSEFLRQLLRNGLLGNHLITKAEDRLLAAEEAIQ